MSGSTLAASEPNAPDDLRAMRWFEQWIYEYSPLGTLATTLCIFVFAYGTFLLIAVAEHVTLATESAGAIRISGGVWPAFVLSLMLTTVLGIQRYTRVKEAREIDALARILVGGMETATRLALSVPRSAKLGRATLVGAAAGLVLSAAILVNESSAAFRSAPGLAIWFVVIITWLIMLFARGVELTRCSNRIFGEAMDRELRIDLLRADSLAVMGRSAARASLVWLSVSAVTLLFFGGGEPLWFILAMTGSCAGMGLWIFVRIMQRIHLRIQLTKRAELERTREAIVGARHALETEPSAGSRLQGLLAYEHRIEQSPEWPFDQPTAMRVCAYILIPAIPWFGQAAAQYFVEALARISG